MLSSSRLRNAPAIPIENGTVAQGMFLNPMRWRECFQDSAGTTPVTVLGQPVGKTLDFSGFGHHVTQATAASRWTIQARINQLISTATASTQSVTVLATQQTLSFKGTGTVTLSGVSTAGPLVGTGAGNRVSLTFTPTAGSLTLTVSGTVTEWQLQEGPAFTNYQGVVTATDYTDIGIPPYFLLDGVDDSGQTAAIDFSMTDAVNCWSGLKKRSNSTTQVIFELSANSDTSDGSFNIGCNVSGTNFYTQSRGTARASRNIASVVSPVLSRVFMSANISADALSISLNEGTPITSATNQGTGNYRATHAMNFGRRNGTSFPFGGGMYPQIIYGADVSAAYKQQNNRWLKAYMNGA